MEEELLQPLSQFLKTDVKEFKVRRDVSTTRPTKKYYLVGLCIHSIWRYITGISQTNGKAAVTV